MSKHHRHTEKDHETPEASAIRVREEESGMETKKNWVELDLGGKVPVRSWVPAEELYADGELLAQARNASNHPLVAGPVVLCPDTHQGFGVPIGSVVALEGGVSCNMVGVDIGCGVGLVRVDATEDELRWAIAERSLLPGVGARIPLGPGGRFDRAVSWRTIPDSALVAGRLESTPYQLGTMGGGNHAAEWEADAEGRVWFMIHSGSRHLGAVVAKHYHELALAMNRAAGVELPHADLAYLPEGTPEFDAYVEALSYCLDWALENRKLMMRAAVTALSESLGRRVSVEDELNVHHNTADLEAWGGRKVWVHRKGATPADAGVRGAIPGHMGLGTYLTTGLGSVDSYATSSHGVGRAMGRNVAKRTLDIEVEKAKLDAAGVTLWTPGGYKSVLDEMPGSYHEPALVMERQSDLVHVEGLLRSVGNVKG